MATVETVLGYPVTTLSADECVDEFLLWMLKREGTRFLLCANPHSLVTAREDPEFRDALMGADMVVPDGTGVVMASWLMGGGIKRRVTGSDIFARTSERLDRMKGHRAFFLGSTEETLAKIVHRYKADYPDLGICGVYSPPFKDEFSAEDDELMVSAVNKARPDVLWVGMTAPKQEKWIHRNLSRLDVPFVAAVGAVFDYYAGTVKRPHPWFRKMGLEWLPRLLREPRRLWGRNFVSTPRFVLRVLKEKLGPRRRAS